MRKFLFVLLIVLLGIGVLAACAPIENIGSEVGDYARALPAWVIVVGAVVLFFIGFAIILKLIPGFVKVIALIALVIVIVGISIGLWSIPLDFINSPQNTNSSTPIIDKETIDKAGEAIKDLLPQSSSTP